MRSLRHATFLVLLAGCTGSDRPAADPALYGDAAVDADEPLSREDGAIDDAGEDDASVSEEDGDAAIDRPQLCPVRGRFRVTRIYCADHDVTLQTTALFHDLLGDFADAEATCEVALRTANDACSESSRYHFVYDAEHGRMIVTTNGIEACDPVACRFDSIDAPCSVGDGAGTWDETIEIESDDRIATTRATGGLCGDRPTKLVWDREVN